MASCKLNKLKNNSFVVLFIFFALLFNTTHVGHTFAASSPQLEKGATDFTAVAKKTIPSVVSVKVKFQPQQKQEQRNDSFDSVDPFEFFHDDFWNRFFGPRRFSQQPRQPQIGQGSGFIISSDGYILTNSHVVRDANTITVLLHDGRELKAKVIGEDPNTDIAVIKIDATNLPYLTLGNSDELEVGQWVVAVGNPLGLQASLTVGVVSAKGRSDLDITRIEDFIQTDAAINRGNSGGPLLNLRGEVIGINTAIASNTSGGNMGIGFAIPSNIAQYVMEQLIEEGAVARGFMGVTLQRIDSDLAQAFNLEKVQGGLVAEVAKGSPAEKARLQQGDIILKYNKIPVESISALRNAVALTKPGNHILLTIKRGDKVFDLNLAVGSYPGGTLTASANQEEKLGIEVEDLTQEAAQDLGYFGEKGIVISKVYPNSPAAFAGLKWGSLIVAVNQQKITNAEQFSKILENTQKGQPVLLLIKQGEVMRFVALKME